MARTNKHIHIISKEEKCKAITVLISSSGQKSIVDRESFLYYQFPIFSKLIQNLGGGSLPCWMCQLKIITCHLVPQNEVTNHCNHWSLTHPERSSGLRSGRRHLRSGKTARTDIQIVIFRRKLYKPNYLHILLLRKALKLLTETPALHDCSKLLLRCVLDYMDPFCQKSHIYWPNPYFFWAVPKSCMRRCLLGYSAQ